MAWLAWAGFRPSQSDTRFGWRVVVDGGDTEMRVIMMADGTGIAEVHDLLCSFWFERAGFQSAFRAMEALEDLHEARGRGFFDHPSMWPFAGGRRPEGWVRVA